MTELERLQCQKLKLEIELLKISIERQQEKSEFCKAQTELMKKRSQK